MIADWILFTEKYKALGDDRLITGVHTKDQWIIFFASKAQRVIRHLQPNILGALMEPISDGCQKIQKFQVRGKVLEISFRNPIDVFPLSSFVAIATRWPVQHSGYIQKPL